MKDKKEKKRKPRFVDSGEGFLVVKNNKSDKEENKNVQS